MSEWIRNEIVEDSFNSLHGIKPVIYQFLPPMSGEMKTKLNYGGKEIILKEVLKNGLTSSSSLEYSGDIKVFNSVYNTEVEAVKILKGA